MDDGFILPKRRSKRCFRQCKRRIAGQENWEEPENITFQRICRIMDDVFSNSIRQYSERVIEILHLAVLDRQIGQIRAVGVGNFHGRSFPGADQTALLLCLKEHFKCDVFFQEPRCCSVEKEWLNHKGLMFEPSVDLLKQHATDDMKDVILFYAPHCGHAIYNSIIYAHRRCLTRVIIIGNCFKKMDLNRLMTKTDELYSGRVKETVCANRNDAYVELDALSCYAIACESISLPEFFDNYSAFNDTAIHYIQDSRKLPAISNKLPQYKIFSGEIILPKDHSESDPAEED